MDVKRYPAERVNPPEGTKSEAWIKSGFKEISRARRLRRSAVLSAAESVNNILAVLFDGVVYSSWLFLMAAGLTLIYGVMKILNIAHGSLYALGAYTAATLAGAWLAAGYAAAGSYAMLALAALLVGAVMGPLIERGLLKWMYGKDEVVLLLITYAVFLILEDTIKLVWGVESKLLPEPYALPGNFQIGTLAYPVYNLLLIAVAMLDGTCPCLGALSDAPGQAAARRDPRPRDQRRHGHQRRPCLPRHLHASARCWRAWVARSQRRRSRSRPGIGVEVIVLSFAVVVVGGLGSLGGAALGALMVGIVRSVAVRYWPEAELFTIYFVMATGSDRAAQGPVQPAGGAQDMNRDRTVPALASVCALLLAAGAARAAVARLSARAFTRQGPGRAGAGAAHAHRAGVVRPGPLLRPRRLLRGAAREPRAGSATPR